MVMAEAERAGGGQNDMEKELTCSVSRGPAFVVVMVVMGWWCCGWNGMEWDAMRCDAIGYAC
jgi:hypothetical protein